MNKDEFLSIIAENKLFDFKNIHSLDWCRSDLWLLDMSYLDKYSPNLIEVLKWNYGNRHPTAWLNADLFLKEFNSVLVIDEKYKFTSIRKKTLELYVELPLRYDLDEYIRLCSIHCNEADQYQKLRTRIDFNFPGGAQAKRALFDVLVDVKPLRHNLKPTIRISEFEIEKIDSKEEVVDLIESKVALYL